MQYSEKDWRYERASSGNASLIATFSSYNYNYSNVSKQVAKYIVFAQQHELGERSEVLTITSFPYPPLPPPFPLPLMSFLPSLPLKLGPLNPARGSGVVVTIAMIFLLGGTLLYQRPPCPSIIWGNASRVSR